MIKAAFNPRTLFAPMVDADHGNLLAHDARRGRCCWHRLRRTVGWSTSAKTPVAWSWASSFSGFCRKNREPTSGLKNRLPLLITSDHSGVAGVCRG